ncbi:MAG: helix-turn-helix domain-containing protein [Gaiellaceae bacterium]
MPAGGGDAKGVGEFIRMQRELARLSLRQVAGMASISNAYLSQVERGVYKPSAQVLKGIADALHVSVESLYARAGLLDDDDGARTTVEEAIRLDERLTDEQKETLVRVYRGLAGPG